MERKNDRPIEQPDRETALRVKQSLAEQYWLPVSDWARKEVPPEFLQYARNITGMGVGWAIVDGKPVPDKWVVRIYVERKFPDDLPAIMRPPSQLNGIPVEIVESGRFRSTGPLQLGSDISIKDSGIDGSLGAFVSDQSGNTYLLTCAHVLHACPGTEVVQLNSNNIQSPAVAILKDSSTFSLGTQQNPGNTVDCAIAKLKAHAARSNSLPNGVPQIQGNADAMLSDVVIHTRSPLSNGFVHSINTTVEVDFPFGTYYFADQVMVHPQNGQSDFAVPGDSGSLVIRKNGANDALGLVFASGVQATTGGGAASVSAVCPINTILTSFPGLTLKLI
jgi:hypothetical protein